MRLRTTLNRIYAFGIHKIQLLSKQTIAGLQIKFNHNSSNNKTRILNTRTLYTVHVDNSRSKKLNAYKTIQQ